MKDAIRQALTQHLKARRTVTYQALAKEVGLAPPHSIHRLTLILEELIREDHSAGRPLVAAAACGRHGLPGRGFFMLLAELGRGEGEPEALYAAERAAAEAYY